jgi:hypothetical protein
LEKTERIMPSPAGLSAILLPLALLAPCLLAPAAAAQDRCEGTLCDLYYHGDASAPTPQGQPPAATPLSVPSGGILGFFSGNRAATPAAPGAPAAPGRAPLVQMQGGGLVGLANGGARDRCEGTLCDLYYGGPPPEKPPAPTTARSPVAPTESVEADPDVAPTPTRVRRGAEPGVQYEKPHCAATAADPWKCYR